MSDTTKTAAEMIAAHMATMPVKAARAATPGVALPNVADNTPEARVMTLLATGQNGIDIMGGRVGTGTGVMHEVWLRAVVLGRPIVTDKEMTASIAGKTTRPTRPHYATQIGRGLVVKDGAGYRASDAIVALVNAMIASEKEADAKREAERLASEKEAEEKAKRDETANKPKRQKAK